MTMAASHAANKKLRDAIFGAAAACSKAAEKYGQDKVVEGTYQIEDGQVITELNGYKSPFQHQIVNNELVLIWKVSDNEIREYHKIADN